MKIITTFEEFVSSREFVADIGAVIGDEGEHVDGVPGAVYDGSWFIADQSEKHPDRPRWWLMFERSEYESNDLGEVERVFWDEWLRDELLPDAERAQDIAKEFARLMQEQLDETKLHQAIRDNRVESDPRICHSHDHCDANEVMVRAFIDSGLGRLVENVGVEPNDAAGGMSDYACALWNAAWRIAAADEFGTQATDDLRACRFYMVDGPIYRGYTDGSTWNGWSNVWVTPQVRDQLVAALEVDALGNQLDRDESVCGIDELPIDERGLVSLADGYCCSLEEGPA